MGRLSVLVSVLMRVRHFDTLSVLTMVSETDVRQELTIALWEVLLMQLNRVRGKVSWSIPSMAPLMV
jgi:hypothetical protein